MRDSIDDEAAELGELSTHEMELLRQRAARYASPGEAAPSDVAEAVVFHRGGSRWAVPLSALREVRPLRGFCEVPGASACVPGILHIRGEILSLHDVGAFMDPAAPPRDAAWVILVEHAGERIGLAADEIVDIEQYATSALTAMPVTLGDRAGICEGILPFGAVLLSPARMFHTQAFFSAF